MGEKRTVIDTGYFVCALRSHCEFEVDPYAERLMGDEGESLWDYCLKYSEGTAHWVARVLGLRTIYFDKRISEFIINGGKQVVILGAGMDSRAFRLDVFKKYGKDITVFEVDFENTFKIKEERLGQDVEPLCNRITIPLDIRKNDWDEKILRSGHFDKSKPTFFMLEGLVMYLPESTNLEMFQKISDLACKASQMSFDFVPKMATQSPDAFPFPFNMTSLVCQDICNARWIFGLDTEKEITKMLKPFKFGKFEFNDGFSPEYLELCNEYYGNKWNKKELQQLIRPKLTFWETLSMLKWMIFSYLPDYVRFRVTGIRRGNACRGSYLTATKK